MELLLFALAAIACVHASSSPWKYEMILAQGMPNTNLGDAVAINANGTVVLASSTFRSGAIVFTKHDNGEWDNQPLLEGNTVESLAMSADGNTVLLGTPRVYENGEWNDIGAAWVFTKQAGNNDSYVLEATLLAGDAVIGLASKQGAAVALSRNGNTALVGAPQDDPRFDPSDDYGGYGYLGATYVYTRNSNAVWTRQQKLVHSKAYCLKKTTCLAQGHKVALSGNGNYAVVYANLQSEADPTTFLFVRNANTNRWAEQAKKFVGGRWGFAISRTGTKLVIGGTGAFERTSSSWQNRQGLGAAWNAGPTAMNANGDLIVVGMDVYYGNREVWYGQYVASRWQKVGTVNMTQGFRANAVSMSEDGTVLVVGNGAGVRVLQSTLDTATPTQFVITSAPSTAIPTLKPSAEPTSMTPTLTPSLKPTSTPTLKPSLEPTSTLTLKPSLEPASLTPTLKPTSTLSTTFSPVTEEGATNRPSRLTFPPFTKTPTRSSSAIVTTTPLSILILLFMFVW